MRKLGLKKVTTLMLVLCMMVQMIPNIYAATTFSDINGHWAEDEIKEGISKGFVKGYLDKTFKPNQPVSRAEFSKMLNDAIGVTGMVNISMKDIKSSDWYYIEVRKAVAAGYITGYTDNTFKPNNNITRQEAASMLSKILPNYGTSVSLNSLKDNGSISNWAKDGVSAVYARGYMKGDTKNMYRPTGALTRAEACTILVRLTEGESIISSDYSIDSNGTSLSKKIFTNNVTISNYVGDGDITLDKIVVLGTLNILGGGENTVSVSDSRIGIMNVAKSTGDVHVLLSGDSEVNDTLIKNGSIIEQKNITSDGFKSIRLNGSRLSTQETTFIGNFPAITLESASLVNLSSGKITNLTINPGAATATVNLNSGTSVTTTNVNGKTIFTGTGKITEMKANVNDITYDTKPTNITTGSGVTRPPVIADDNEGPIPVVTPTNASTGIATNTKVTIVFNEPIYLANGNNVNNSDISNIIEIRESSATGNKIAYSGTISSDKKTLTITPTNFLENNINYYVILLKGTIEDEKDNENNKVTTYFKTGTVDITPPESTISPANSEANISIDSKITITFDEAIKLANGNAITNSNISSFIELRESSATGSSKSYTATINSTKKIIEITPSTALTANTYYYVIILEGKIVDDRNNLNKKVTSYFRTKAQDNNAPRPTFSPANSDTNVAVNSKITITFDEAIKLADGNPVTNTNISTFIVLRQGSTSGTSRPYTATINSAMKVIEITPSATLANDTNYYIMILDKKIRDDSYNLTLATNSTFKTAGVDTIAPVPTWSPANGATNVAANTSITITFNEAIKLENGNAVTNSNINTFIELREGTPSGASRVYTATINTDKKVIVITPSATLANDTNYYVIILDRMVKDDANNLLLTTTSSFRTIAVAAATPTITTNPTNTAAIANDGTVTVTMETTTSGASIYYTVDGSVPNASSTPYAGPIVVGNTQQPNGATVTINAVAIKPGLATSTTATKSITFVSNRVAQPTITTTPTDVSAIPSNNTVEVELTSTTSGATIYYSTDGVNWIQYNSEIPISTTNPSGETITVSAKAEKVGMTNSTIATTTITFIDNRVGIPTITTVIEEDKTVTVTITNTTEGATRYFSYTTDGSEPTSAPTEYSGSFSINAPAGSTITIKAYATKAGMVDSAPQTIVVVNN